MVRKRKTRPEADALTDDALRGWLARNPINDFNGAKTGSRLYLSALDCFYYSIVAALTGFGVPVRIAMLSATQHANAARDELPDYDYLVVRREGGSTEFSLSDVPDFDERPTLVLPLRSMAKALIERAAVVYATDESAPRKLGTVNGQPIKEWASAVEAEIAKMPVCK